MFLRPPTPHLFQWATWFAVAAVMGPNVGGGRLKMLRCLVKVLAPDRLYGLHQPTRVVQAWDTRVFCFGPMLGSWLVSDLAGWLVGRLVTSWLVGC